MGDISRELGLRIQARMEQIGVRPVDLSRTTGLSPSQVSRILSGTYGVTLETLLRIASGLRCEPGLLLPSNDESLVEMPTDPATKADIERILLAVNELRAQLARGVMEWAQSELSRDVQNNDRRRSLNEIAKTS